jgi:hypothetical protein
VETSELLINKGADVNALNDVSVSIPCSFRSCSLKWRRIGQMIDDVLRVGVCQRTGAKVCARINVRGARYLLNASRHVTSLEKDFNIDFCL